MRKITQKKAAFYKLYKEFKEDPKRYVAIWEFVGEIYVEPINKWVLMSYTCPHRVFEVYSENPGLIERKMLQGKSGSSYYGYRIREGVTVDDIEEDTLREFYALIRGTSYKKTKPKKDPREEKEPSTEKVVCKCGVYMEPTLTPGIYQCPTKKCNTVKMVSIKA